MPGSDGAPTVMAPTVMAGLDGGGRGDAVDAVDTLDAMGAGHDARNVVKSPLS
jgi:hypothetical protein